uniref:Uncharacterized protein n=1 Tax=Lepeophtheirus salmonis TaxID=72036 RepID=A0A0K2TUQ0_LEPSM
MTSSVRAGVLRMYNCSLRHCSTNSIIY